MNIYITRNTAIHGKSVEADPEQVVQVSDEVGRALISANKAVRVKEVDERPEIEDEEGFLEELQAVKDACEAKLKEQQDAHAASAEKMGEAFEKALVERNEACDAVIKAATEKHEAVVAELVAKHAAEVEQLKKAKK